MKYQHAPLYSCQVIFSNCFHVDNHVHTGLFAAEYLRRKNAGEERPENWMDDLEPVEEVVRATKTASDSARAAKTSASNKEKQHNKKRESQKTEEGDNSINKEDDTDALLRKCENQEFSK